MPIMRIMHAILLLTLISTAVATASPATSCPTATALCVFRNSTAFGSTVIVTEQSTYYSVFSNSLPNHVYKTGINPAVSAQSNTLRIPKTVTRATTTTTLLGSLGVMFNGVSVYSSADARTITSCTGNAGYLELASLDSYGGHPDPRGNYHYHVAYFLQSAASLQLTHTPTAHSSLLGWAADGLPIYGPYGFASSTSTTITLLKSCYVLKSARTCCTDAAQCGTTAKVGQTTLGLGAFNEDYEFNSAAYNAGDCHLDEYNTRVSATPEFPSSSTRYYVFTMNADNSVSFPYIFHGAKGLYGQLIAGNNNGNTATAGTTATGATTTTAGTTAGGTTATGTIGGTTTAGGTTATGTTGATTAAGRTTATGGATTTTGIGGTTGGATTTGASTGAAAITVTGGNNNARPSTTESAVTSSEGSSSNSVAVGVGIGVGVGGLIVILIIGAGAYFYFCAPKATNTVMHSDPRFVNSFYSKPGVAAPVSTPVMHIV